MSTSSDYDAIVVGSGPNGLAAAVTLARAGRKTLVIEARDTIGGGTRSAELTLPGFIHDICSAIHPLGLASPFFKALPLSEHGLEWVQPPAALAHPLDDGTAMVVQRSIEATVETLSPDASGYRRLFSPFVDRYEALMDEFLGPLRLPPHHPFLMAAFGLPAIFPAHLLAKLLFRGERARAVFAGMAAHSIMSLEKPTTSAFGLMLTLLAHAVGWPMAAGGSQKIADSLASYFRSLGGEIITGQPVKSLDELPRARAVLLDVTPRQFIRLAAGRLPSLYQRRLEGYRYGPGVFKMDFALDGPIPWKNPDCATAGTVHIGGTLDEIAAAEHETWRGGHPEKPFVLLAQHSLFDKTRAPDGKHTAWAYCHVPNGSTVDMSGRIEAQIERFAPGFRDRILARAVHSPAQLEAYNPNYIGGDINGGVQDIRQLFTRPVFRPHPHTTPLKGVYLCSSSTPPGGGVHGMCGYYAAQIALQQMQ